MIEVRATINLPGLRAGAVVWVDPENEYVADCIEAGFLVPVEEEE